MRHWNVHDSFDLGWRYNRHYNRRRCMSNINITVSQIKRAIVIYQKYDRRGYESPSVYGPLDCVKSLTSRVRGKLYSAVEGIEVVKTLSGLMTLSGINRFYAT